MDPRLEQLLGHAKASREAAGKDDRHPREDGLAQFADDVRNRGRRATDKLSHTGEGTVEHAKDFTHRRT